VAKNKEWAAKKRDGWLRRGKNDLEDGWVAKKRDRWLRREMDMGKLAAPLASALVLEYRHFSKIINGRHKQRSGQQTRKVDPAKVLKLYRSICYLILILKFSPVNNSMYGI
jgi:hypothetical protein